MIKCIKLKLCRYSVIIHIYKHKISQVSELHYFLAFPFLSPSPFSTALTKIIGHETLKRKPLQSQVAQYSAPPGRYLVTVNTTMLGLCKVPGNAYDPIDKATCGVIRLQLSIRQHIVVTYLYSSV